MLFMKEEAQSSSNSRIRKQECQKQYNVFDNSVPFSPVVKGLKDWKQHSSEMFASRQLAES